MNEEQERLYAQTKVGVSRHSAYPGFVLLSVGWRTETLNSEQATEVARQLMIATAPSEERP